MESGIIYYEIEKRDKYEDSDERADSNLAVVRTRRYHIDDEPFIHPLHSARSVRVSSRVSWPLSVRSLRSIENPHFEDQDSQEKQEVSSSQDRRIREAGRPIKRWELISPSEELKIGEEKKEKDEEEEDPEEDVFEEEMPALPQRMDVDADEDYLQYLEELQQYPEDSLILSSQAFAQRPSDDKHSQSSDGHSQPSYDLFGVWPPPVGSSQ
ncbi:hypothetical protein PIB30_016209 [Stylosanthes scabra]|uniref:Uncharacterized protein n=1 Tax=Stylosanthes scabra TaxID=79078 RepID=A0ABU6V6P9_9FABA|nr:hypothetical protein [Stylosanthes scabra]